jgi:predicted DNA-binding transcriptional regulator
MLTRIFFSQFCGLVIILQRGFSQIWLKDKEIFIYFLLFQFSEVASIANISREI